MEVLVQTTTENDFPQTENLTREAFWNLYKPGCVEHLILHNMRKSNSYIRKLDLIAVFENKIIGHIISTRAKVIDSQNNEHDVFGIGPLSVLPEFQKMGIGSTLMHNSMMQLKSWGFQEYQL